MHSKNKYLALDYIIAIPVSNVDRAKHAIINTIIIAVIAGLILATIISTRLAKLVSEPLQNTVKILQNISEGEGDLTLRIPEKGNDEITLLSKYFNMTFEKLRNTVSAVIDQSGVMGNVAAGLSESMEEEEAINKISENIASTRNKVTNQAAGAEKTSETVKNISGNIQNLNRNIEIQYSSVAQSSSAIEEMVANIMQEISSITNEVKQNAVEMEQGGQIMMQQMESLAFAAAEISGSMNEMSESVSEMNGSIQKVNDKTVENNQSIRIVSNEIRKFKV